MSIKLNDNIKINAGKPSESKYLNSSNIAYSSTTEATTAIPISERHLGLTVLVDTETSSIEYWFKEDVNTLIEKKFDSVIPTEDFVTGATNLGFFSGFTGVQTLSLSTIDQAPLPNYLDYDGDYTSLYNWFYRGEDGVINIGTPNDGILKRGYVKTSPLPIKSWIWNEYTGGTNLVGWILINGDINNIIGTFQSGIKYYTGASKVYTQTTWTIPTSNGSSIAISAVNGSLTTGNTLTIGGPIFSFKEHNDLHLRTIKTNSPTIIDVTYDEAFIYISGTTSILNRLSGATNGLTAINNVVTLGGALTGATTLSMSGSTSLIFTDTRAAKVGVQYDDDYGSTFIARSIVDAGYVTGITYSGPLIKSVCIPTINDYQALSTDYYIGVSGGSCVTLPISPTCGMSLIIADISSLASIGCPILISGNIYGYPTAEIDTCYGSLSLIYNGVKWGIHAFPPAIA